MVFRQNRYLSFGNYHTGFRLRVVCFRSFQTTGMWVLDGMA